MRRARIYVACLASYNNGVLHGRWIDLDGASVDEVQAEIAEMLRESPYPNVLVTCPDCGGTGKADDGDVSRGVALPDDLCLTCKGTGEGPSAEEWAVHDHEGLPGGFKGEHPDLGALCARLEELEELSDDEREAFDAFASVEHEPSVETFRERYIGEFNSWADLAEHVVEEQGLLHDVPESLQRYFDFEAYGRDLRVGGDAYEEDGHYFWNH